MPNQLEFYYRHYTALFQPLLSLMRHGVLVDRDRATALRAEMLTECTAIQEELADIAGANMCTCEHGRAFSHRERPAPVALTKAGKPRKRQPKSTWPCKACNCDDFTAKGKPLHAKKDLSSARVVTFLYDFFGFPKQRKRGEESLSAEEIFIRKLLLKAQQWQNEDHKRVAPDAALWKRDPALAVHACQLILQHREKFKTAGFVDENRIDEDNRMRCQYKFTTRSGRLSSKSNPYGTGSNLQNVQRSVRSCFVPDPGCLFVEADYSQAESRVVDVLTKDPALIARARMHPTEFDAHTFHTRRIFSVILKCPPDKVEITKERRQIGKSGKHGANYGEHGKKLSESLLKDGYVLTPDEGEAIIQAAMEPPILQWQRTIRKRLMRDGYLENSWGRVLSFRGERLNDDTYRKGYAFIPSSEVADDLNQLGLIPVYNWLKASHMRSKLNLQVHDNVVISALPTEAYDIAVFLQEHMEVEREYEGVKLSIPVEFKIGTRWGCGICDGCRGKTKCSEIVEFKRLPPRAEFNELVCALTRAQRKAA